MRSILQPQRKAQPSPWCPVCGSKEIGFLPLPDVYSRNARLHGFAHFGQGEMTSHAAYSCDGCGASDRERLYALWLEQELNERRMAGNARVVHFAPEPALSRKLKELQLFDYVTADLHMAGVDHVVDLMNMPFAADSFDFFICSHVLEHVESDSQAISELYRITKPGGRGILMAPIIMGLERTIEDPSVSDEAGRWRLFGQHDHVRLYARDDYIGRMQAGGFHVEQLGEEYFGRDAFKALGLKSTSVLYVVSK